MWLIDATNDLTRHAVGSQTIVILHQQHQKLCPAEGKYHEFLEGAGRWRYDVWRTLLERDQTRQMMEALTRTVATNGACGDWNGYTA